MSTFALSDLHAQYNLWKQIKDYLKPNDILYCLGDVVDRGDASLEIFNEMMEMDNVIFLLGNHENFISTIGYNLLHYNDEDFNEKYENLLLLWYYNGAEKTIDTFFNMGTIERRRLIDKIKNLPTCAIYLNKNKERIYLCHAGRQPGDTEIMTKNGSNWVWDRTHIEDIGWYGKEKEYCVHGHTPTVYMRDYLNVDELKKLEPIQPDKILKYCEGHKIDIDLCSPITHTACLLDLDTLEPIYFKEEVEENE